LCDVNISLSVYESECDSSDDNPGNNDPRSGRVITQAVMAEIYYFSRNGSNASLRIQGDNRFVLLRGSKIASVVQPFSTAQGPRNRYRHLISLSFEILQDIVFTTPSGAAAFVSGAADNGWIAWKTSTGKTIDDIIADERRNLS